MGEFLKAENVNVEYFGSEVCRGLALELGLIDFEYTAYSQRSNAHMLFNHGPNGQMQVLGLGIATKNQRGLGCFQSCCPSSLGFVLKVAFLIS